MRTNLIVILGPTASGKTGLAARLAAEMDAEIISADSRQVYRGMDLGTGKDLNDYVVEGRRVPCHLIDVVEPDYEFSVFDYQRSFFQCFSQIRARNILPIMVGGTGLYIDAVLKGYRMHRVPENEALRAELEKEDADALVKRLREINPFLHNTTDTLDRGRLIRAIEIAHYSSGHGKEEGLDFPEIRPFVIGIRRERSVLHKMIARRLEERLASGMIEEVKNLHSRGISWERLDSFGLEYRYIGLYLQGMLDYETMCGRLNTRINQFAKRQETWFRRMERQGIDIHWLDDPQYEELKLLVRGALS